MTVSVLGARSLVADASDGEGVVETEVAIGIVTS